MADLPPAYRDNDHEEVPSYTEDLQRTLAWHIVGEPSKGTVRRSISLVPISQSPTLSTYKLQYTASLTFDGKQLTSETASSAASVSGIDFAKAELSITKPDVGSFTVLTNNRAQKIFVDGERINSTIQTHELSTSDGLLASLSLSSEGQYVSLPFAWRLEPRQAENPAPSSIETDPVIREESTKMSLNFWKKDKSKQSHKKKQSIADIKLDRQKAMLGSSLELIDQSGTTFAKFTNDLYNQSSSQPPPSIAYDATKSYKNWGILTIQDYDFAKLRATSGIFEKWSTEQLEHLVLMSFVMTLEINLRLQGGDEGQAFKGSRNMGLKAADCLGAEGFLGVTSATLGALSRGSGHMFRLSGGDGT